MPDRSYRAQMSAGPSVQPRHLSRLAPVKSPEITDQDRREFQSFRDVRNAGLEQRKAGYLERSSR